MDTEILNAMREGNEFVVQDRAVEDQRNTTSGFIQGIELEGSKYVRKAYLGVPYVLISEKAHSHSLLHSKTPRYAEPPKRWKKAESIVRKWCVHRKSDW